MPSDHIGLEEKRLQLQPRSPLGMVLPGVSTKLTETEACLGLSQFIPRLSLHQREGKDTWTGTLSLICVSTWPGVWTPLNKTWSYYYVLLLVLHVYTCPHCLIIIIMLGTPCRFR